jgi:hypothetical protein
VSGAGDPNTFKTFASVIREDIIARTSDLFSIPELSPCASIFELSSLSEIFDHILYSNNFQGFKDFLVSLIENMVIKIDIHISGNN